VAILREMHYKDGYSDILEKFVNKCTDMKYYVLEIHALKYILNFKIKTKICD
jgi:hypothetical protein